MKRATAVLAAVFALTVGAVFTLGSVADDKPGSPAKLRESPKPKGGAKLEPDDEEKLRWGGPVNGLRAAIAIRDAPGEPKAGDRPDLYLVVQNVSSAPIRLSDTTGAPKLRSLKIKLDGMTQMAIEDKDPTRADVLLRPREVAFLLVFASDSKDKGGRTSGSLIADDTLKDGQITLVGELKIEQAPAGAWTGKLVTGESSGAVAAAKPRPKDR